MLKIKRWLLAAILTYHSAWASPDLQEQLLRGKSDIGLHAVVPMAHKVGSEIKQWLLAAILAEVRNMNH